MQKLMPLKRAVVVLTHEAEPGDEQGIRKAVKAWHNRLAGGSIPRSLVMRLGKELYLVLDAWEEWLNERLESVPKTGRGRPRADARSAF